MILGYLPKRFAPRILLVGVGFGADYVGFCYQRSRCNKELWGESFIHV